MAVNNITEWLQQLPIPWLVGGTHGNADVTSYGTVLDSQVAQLKEATKARMPFQAPSDALAHIGGDRGLIQGPTESNANFETRLNLAWNAWEDAGTAGELLLQLYYYGFRGAVLVTQNGLGYYLDESSTIPPNANQINYVISFELSAAPVAITCSTNTTRSIPANTPWWFFDANTDFTSRFAIIFTNPLSDVFITHGTASFVASNTATVTWNNSFSDGNYSVLINPPTFNTGTAPALAVQSGSKMALNAVLASSITFTGAADVVAFPVGANPFANLHDLGLSRRSLHWSLPLFCNMETCGDIRCKTGVA